MTLRQRTETVIYVGNVTIFGYVLHTIYELVSLRLPIAHRVASGNRVVHQSYHRAAL